MARRLEGATVRRLLPRRSTRTAGPAASSPPPAPPPLSEPVEAGAGAAPADGQGARSAEAAHPALPDTVVHAELDRVAHVLEEHGALSGQELKDRVGAHEWDSTAWARILRVGSREERIVYRFGRYYPSYSAAEQDADAGRGRARR